MRRTALMLVLVAACEETPPTPRQARPTPESQRLILAQPISNNCRYSSSPCEVRTLTVREGSTFQGDLQMDAGHIYAHGITLSAVPGDDAVVVSNSGAHIQVGPGVNESIFGTGGSGPQTPGSWSAGGEILAGPDGYRVLTANTWKGRGYALDAGTSFMFQAGAKPVDGGVHMAWQCGEGNETVAQMTCDGYMYSKVPEVLASLYTNSVNNPATYGGWYLTKPFTVTHISIYVSNAAGAGTNDVLRVTDGTNNCEVTFSCASDLNTTGVKFKTPSGTCVFAAGASLVLSETTAGCAPDPTLKNITIMGWNQ